MPLVERTTLRTLLSKFIALESSSSLILAASTILALVIANSPLAETYHHALEADVLGLSVHHWINDGLMTVFFYVVGLEIKREMLVGELSSVKKASLPILAAIGGMIVPALIYASMNYRGAFSGGWAIPMATDIAFALGVLGIFGKRVPLPLKIFLLALAIVDDLGAILVIAIFYTSEIRTVGLLVAGASIAAVLGAKLLRIQSYFVYLIFAVVLWYGVFYSGVHATIAGVILGFLTPFKSFGPESSAPGPIDSFIHKLHPVVGFAIMPIFALANAGLPVSGEALSGLFTHSVSLGVLAGLLLGKPLGILLFTGLAVRFGIAKLAKGLEWKDLIGAAFLAGIGFTMAIFIANLSLPEEQSAIAKLAVMGASLLSAVVGYLILRWAFAKTSAPHSAPHAAPRL